MSGIINLLPDSLANKIAAGEVVQRPASAVKELLENAIDAGATEITLVVKDAGKSLIQVIDNGKGMSEFDARMCFERHATSKIKDTEDLFNINTFGFRGEAMASIAAVAQVELKTKQTGSELGTLIQIEGSEIKKQEATATKDGSIISIKNLFFNVPARRNFLKSNPVELRHILDEFHRVALPNPHIAFTLIQNDLEVHRLPKAKLSQRIVSLLGKNYQNQLVAVEEETDFVKVWGYIGKPEAAKKTRGDQYFFVNNRFIKHHYLNHAVLEPFKGLIQDGTFPFYTLFIEIEPKHVDINVHPTKTEVKFDDERTLYAIIRAAVKKGIGMHNIAPSLDFDDDVNFGISTVGKRDYEMESNPFKHIQSKPSNSGNKTNWQDLYSGFEKKPQEAIQHFEQEDDHSLTIESKINQQETIDSTSEKPTLSKASEMVFQVQSRYIVTQVKSGMVLIDQQAAHERILFEKYKSIQKNKTSASQQFLFPQNIELSKADFALVMDMADEIKALGFVFDVFGEHALVINGIPSDVTSGDEKGLFEGFIEQYKLNQNDIKLDNNERLARALAKRSAMKPGKNLATEEMKALVDQLFACETPNFAPDGNMTFVLLDLNSIKGFFNK